MSAAPSFLFVASSFSFRNKYIELDKGERENKVKKKKKKLEDVSEMVMEMRWGHQMEQPKGRLW